MMGSSLVATSLSSRTTTSLGSKTAPRQQPVACWLWTPTVYLWTLSPIWFLSVPRLIASAMYDVLLGHVSSACLLDLAQWNVAI